MNVFERVLFLWLLFFVINSQCWKRPSIIRTRSIMFHDVRWRPTISTGSRCESSTKLSTVPIKNYDFKLKAITDEKASSSSRGRVSYKELVRFGLPTLGIWLLQPILSLIDTAVIGMNPTTTVAELAALGPGIAWVDSSAYLCYFLSVATTNLFANALRENDVSQARTVLANAISFASVLGVILGVVQYDLAGQSISLLSGSSRLSVPYGVTYVRIRALAAPAALLTMVAQSAFLASKDSTTPLKAVLIGACVNAIGDVALVRGLKLGVAGAAWATAGSQVAGILYLIYAAVSQRVKSHNTTTTSSLSTTTTLTSTSTTPKKSLLSRARRWLSIVREDIRQPKWSEAKQFLAFCGPLFVVLLIKSFLWTFTTYATSTASDGAVHLAAHQIIINFFVMFCIFGDVVAQIAATYLPYTLHYPHTTPSISTSNSTSNNTTTSPSTSSTSLLPQWSRESRGLISQITVMGSVLGSVNSVFGYLLASFGAKFLTRSTAVIHCMNRVAPLLALSALPHCLMLGYEGVIIAGRDVTFLSFNYVIMALFFLAYQSYVRWRGVGIVGVWVGMVLLQWSRLLVFFLRQRKIVGENMLRAERGERQGGD